MLGSICGDIIGSRYEFDNTQDPNFPFFTEKSTFTDDTVLTIATADVLLSKKNGTPITYLAAYQNYFDLYPNRGWGGHFAQLASQNLLAPYNSFGNGSAMRVSPIGWMFDNVEDTLREARKSAEVTHNHPEGIKGAQAIALAMYLARNTSDKRVIKEVIQGLYRYDLGIHYSQYPKFFDETCQGTVPIALNIFLETSSYGEAIKASILNGGDVDTIACMVGGIAEAYYGEVPEFIVREAYKLLPTTFCNIIDNFYSEIV
jgi:ADP-ribosylglycohydrolase